MNALYLIIGFVTAQRLAEMVLAHYNTRRLLAEGAVEVGAKHYPLFFVVHGSWLLANLVFTPAETPIHLPFLGILVLAQCARFWVIATLGRYWTTRIITLPTRPLVKKGPYRFLRHPNYWVVTVEIAALPLVFGNWEIALIWSLANAALLYWRIKLENQTLNMRAALH